MDNTGYTLTYAGVCPKCAAVATITAANVEAYDQQLGDELFTEGDGVKCPDCGDAVVSPIMVGVALAPWVAVHFEQVAEPRGIVV